jgi:hypothetical protein
MLTLIL